MPIPPDVETTVVGAGVVGLAIAAACARLGQDVVVLERNASIGQEISSRSSEVIHAGLYYPSGSLKAVACVAGRKRLYDFAAENGIAAKRVGKLVVATSPAEIVTLKKIEAHARANGVDDVRWLSSADARALEPEISCSAALLSPSTGIVDSHGLMKSLEGHLQTHNGSVVLQSDLQAVRLNSGDVFELDIASGGQSSILTTRNLVVAAGLGMARLRDVLPAGKGYEAPRTGFAKGHYFSLLGSSPFRHLVYPVPVDGGLGTHLTLDLQGRARFGPDVEWIDSVDYSFNDCGGARRAEYERSIRHYWPGLPPGALEPGYTGIRPKISAKGQPAADFEIHGPERHGIGRLVALYGIESPGRTSSLEIAERCAAILRS